MVLGGQEDLLADLWLGGEPGLEPVLGTIAGGRVVVAHAAEEGVAQQPIERVGVREVPALTIVTSTPVLPRACGADQRLSPPRLELCGRPPARWNLPRPASWRLPSQPRRAWTKLRRCIGLVPFSDIDPFSGVLNHT